MSRLQDYWLLQFGTVGHKDAVILFCLALGHVAR